MNSKKEEPHVSIELTKLPAQTDYFRNLIRMAENYYNELDPAGKGKFDKALEETGVKLLGSSAKSMGGWWLLKSTKLVIERYLQAVQCFKAVCLFDSEFCLVI